MVATGLRSDASIVAERASGGSGTRLRRLSSSPPLALRAAAGSVWLVGTAAGPLGGDRLRLRVEVGAGAALTVRSTAATVVLGGDSTLEVEVDVGPGGRLRWLPEPTVATARCRHRSSAVVRLDSGASLVWREELVAGRHGEAPGPFTSRLEVERDGRPLLRQELRVGEGAPGWSGPAVLGGAKAAGVVVVVEPAAGALPSTPAKQGAAVMALAGGGVVVSATAPGAASLRRALDEGTAAVRGWATAAPGQEPTTVAPARLDEAAGRGGAAGEGGGRGRR